MNFVSACGDGDAEAVHIGKLPLTARGSIVIIDIERASNAFDPIGYFGKILIDLGAHELALQRDAHGMIGKCWNTASAIVLALSLLANHHFHDVIAYDRVICRGLIEARVVFR